MAQDKPSTEPGRFTLHELPDLGHGGIIRWCPICETGGDEKAPFGNWRVEERICDDCRVALREMIAEYRRR